MKKLTMVIMTVLTMCFGHTAFAADDTPMKKLSENVYVAFINSFQSLVVIGDEGVLIVDPAQSGRALTLKSEIAKLTPLPVTSIVLTHEHYDHVGGTEVFPEAKIYAHKATESVFKLDVIGQAPTKVDHYVGSETTLMIGNTQVDLLHYGAADGVGALAIHLPKEKVVYSADLYEVGHLTDGMWKSDSNYLGSRLVLNALVAFKPLYAITTHSADVDPKALQLGADFYNDLFDVVEPAMKKAMSQGWNEIIAAIKTLPKTVKLPKYKDLGGYEEHLPAHVDRMVFSIFHGG